MSNGAIRIVQTSELSVASTEAFAVLISEMARWPSWTRTYTPLAPIAAGGPQLGDKFPLRARVDAGWSPVRHYVHEKQVCRRDEGRCLVWRGRFLGIEGRHGFELCGLAEGRCRLEEWFEADGIGGSLLRQTGILAGIRRSMQAFQRDLASHLLRRRASPEIRYRRSGAHRFAYVDEGRGEPIVLLHGYPQNHRCWRHQIADLSRTHRVVAPDLLGWGLSGRPIDIDWRFDAEVERLAALLDSFELGPFNLFAHDYGGLLALGYLRKYRDRVRRVALLNTRAHGTFRRAFLWTNLIMQQLFRLPFGRALGSRLPLGWMHERGMRPAVQRGLFDRELLESYVGALSRDRAARLWLTEFFGRGYDFTPQPELATGLDDASRPCAIIWGTADPYVPRKTAEQLAARGTHVECHFLEGGDHFVMEDRPGEVTALLRALLERPTLAACARARC
jgi:pimeloyl-ACP methyl ester carboxylesterase